MPLDRDDRLPGGRHYIRPTTWEAETADAVVDGAATAAGWLIGSGISGLRTLAQNSHDRRLLRAVAALEEASDSEDDDRFLSLATNFVRAYPDLADGHAALAEALQRKQQFDEAISSSERAVQRGFDETLAHMLRADIYDDAGKSAKAIYEYTMVTQVQVPELRQMSLLLRARLLLRIGDSDQALQDANDAIAVLPDDGAYLMRGHVHRNRGDLEACLRDYSRAVQLDPDPSDLLALLEHRADVYETLGRLEEAQADRSAVADARRPHVPSRVTSTATPGHPESATPGPKANTSRMGLFLVVFIGFIVPAVAVIAMIFM